MTDHELRALYQRLVEFRSDPSRSRCPSPEEIVALAELSLPESERVRLLAHVSTCSFCQHDLSLARSVALTRQPARSRGGAWIVLAAAAVVAFAVVLGRSGGDGQVMRSADAELRLVSPSGIVSTADTTFTWRAVPRATRYHMEVISTAGAVVHDAQTADTALAVARGTLPANEYFWRVTAVLSDGSTRASTALGFRVR